MIDLENPGRAQQSGLIAAEAAAVSASGITLILPGQTGATQKKYKRLKGAEISAGDMVLCAKLSGTYVVLGAII